MVTHEIDLAERTQRIIKLKDGEIIEDLKKI
jgi:lipoprotein-releasing system ATP-binding protein